MLYECTCVKCLSRCLVITIVEAMAMLDPCHVLNPESRVMSLESWLLISRLPDDWTVFLSFDSWMPNSSQIVNSESRILTADSEFLPTAVYIRNSATFRIVNSESRTLARDSTNYSCSNSFPGLLRQWKFNSAVYTDCWSNNRTNAFKRRIKFQSPDLISSSLSIRSKKFCRQYK